MLASARPREVAGAPARAASERVDRQLREARHDLHGSMGRVASSADNAAMESFFALLQMNVLDTRRLTTREQLRWPSSPGSNAPTTADDGSAPWAGSPRSSLRPSTWPLTRPETPHPE